MGRAQRLLIALVVALLASTALADVRFGCRFESSATPYTVCTTEYSIAKWEGELYTLDLSLGLEWWNWTLLTPYTALGLYTGPFYMVAEIGKPLDSARFDFAFSAGFSIPAPPIFGPPEPSEEDLGE